MLLSKISHNYNNKQEAHDGALRSYHDYNLIVTKLFSLSTSLGSFMGLNPIYCPNDLKYQD